MILEILVWWILFWMCGFIGGIVDAYNRKVFVVLVTLSAIAVLILMIYAIGTIDDWGAVSFTWGSLGSFLGGITIYLPYHIGYNLKERI